MVRLLSSGQAGLTFGPHQFLPQLAGADVQGAGFLAVGCQAGGEHLIGDADRHEGRQVTCGQALCLLELAG